MNRFLLFAKGVCMGIADIIPGVSGGTLALILGIYAEFVNTIKGLNLRWLPPLWRWVMGGRKAEDRQVFLAELDRMNVVFLIVLGAGIMTAIILGSMVIPVLMERFPEAMRALFFGLILASVWIPFRMIDLSQQTKLIGVLAFAVGGAILGYFVSDPGRTFESANSWVVIESQGESLKEIARRGPSAWTTEAVYWAPENESLRQEMEAAHPQEAAALAASHTADEHASSTTNKDEIKTRSAPYDRLEVPAGVPVRIPQPTYLFVFLAGAIAICAMILPGISGSYILLILGAYFFVLNALKGTIETLVGGGMPWSQVSFVLVFMAGAAIGLLSFARLLSFLLKRYTALTLGALVGLMIGCLRGIWPFRESLDGRVVNVIPAAVDQTVVVALVTCVAGMIVVVVLSRLGMAKQTGRVRRSAGA